MLQPGDKSSASFTAFLRTSFLFALGLTLVLASLELWLSHRAQRKRGVGIFGEVASAVRRARMPSEQVTSVFLGDSVARQLFVAGKEPVPTVRYLTSNQAVSVAGQCYLAEESLKSCPQLRDIYLLYIPGCFANNLPRELSRDYFCGFFHGPGQVLEVFRIKRDFELSAAHVGRMLLPNLMIENSRWQAATPEPTAAPAPSAAADFLRPVLGDEPILALLTRAFSPGPDPPISPAGSYGPALSPVSRHFLDRMRRACESRGVRLHVLPCPLSTRETFADPERVFDAPAIRVDPALLQDAVHFRTPFVAEYRLEMIRAYALPLPRETLRPATQPPVR